MTMKTDYMGRSAYTPAALKKRQKPAHVYLSTWEEGVGHKYRFMGTFQTHDLAEKEANRLTDIMVNEARATGTLIARFTEYVYFDKKITGARLIEG